MNKQIEDHNNLLAILLKLRFEDLILFYVEAKTGSMRNIDKLPISFLETIEEVDIRINNLYAQKVINNLFKEEE